MICKSCIRISLWNSPWPKVHVTKVQCEKTKRGWFDWEWREGDKMPTTCEFFKGASK